MRMVKLGIMFFRIYLNMKWRRKELSEKTIDLGMDGEALRILQQNALTYPETEFVDYIGKTN